MTSKHQKICLPYSDAYALRDLDIFGECEFHHLGTIVNDSVDLISGLVFIRDPIQKVDVAFYKLCGLVVEVVRPYDASSPVSRALEKGEYFHHVCFSVPNIQKALEISKSYGVRRISKLSPAKAFGGRLIAWTYSRRFGLIELLEQSK